MCDDLSESLSLSLFTYIYMYIHLSGSHVLAESTRARERGHESISERGKDTYTDREDRRKKKEIHTHKQRIQRRSLLSLDAAIFAVFAVCVYVSPPSSR